MKRAEKKKRARKFNVSKKICQLNRVATLFSIQYHEQDFQRQYISDQYSSKISMLLNNAWIEAEKNYSEISNIYPAIESEYHDIYRKKYKEIKINLNVFIQSTGEMIQRKLQNISKQIDFKTTEIVQINQKIEKYDNPKFETELFDEFITNLNALVKIQRHRFNEQRNKILVSFNARISLLNNESESRVQKMKTENEIQAGLIKSAFFHNFENKELYHQFLSNFLIPFRKHLKHHQFLLTGIENKFLGTKNAADKSIHTTKKQIFKEIDKIKKIQNKYNSEKNEILKLINQSALIDSPCHKDNIKFLSLDSVKQEFQDKVNNYQKEEEALKTKLSEMQIQFKNKYQFLELNQKGRLSNIESIFRDIQKTQSTEIIKFNNFYNQIEKNITDRITNIEKEISEFIENKEKIEQNYRNQLLTIKSENLISIKSINQEFGKEKEFLDFDFQQRKNQIQNKKTQITFDLKNLQDEKNSILSRFQSFFCKINNDEKREVESILNNSKFLISELQTELTNDFNKFSQKSKEEIKRIQLECQKKKNDKIRQIEFLHSQEILKTQFNLENCQSKSNFDYNRYSEIYKNYQNELNSITPPTSNDNFVSLTIKLSDAKKELNDHIEIIENDRKKLNNLYNSRLQREEERHLKIIDEQKEKLEIISKIEKVRKEKEEKLNELKKSQNQSSNEIDKEFQRNLDIIELRFLNQKALLNKQIESTRKEILFKKEEILNSISELKKSHEIQLKPYQTKYSLILRKQRATLTHSPNSSAIPFDELVLKKMRQHKEKVKKLRETIHDAQNTIQICESEFEHQIFINQQRNKKKFEANEAKLNDELNQLTLKRDELKASLSRNNGFFDVDENSSSFIPSKTSNEERITKLRLRLNNVSQQLSAILAEYKKYKDIFDGQENIMSSSLGANQTVTVLQLTSSHHSIPPKFNVT